MTNTIITFIILIILFFAGYPADATARDLVASLGIVPPHAMTGEDGRPQGGFVDIVRAIDRVYTEGQITIKLYPPLRSMMNVINGKADFHIPAIATPDDPAVTLPFEFASEPIVKVAFVLYTRADRPMLPMDRLGEFHIETLRGGAHFTFKVSQINNFEQGIMKVAFGRSDGFLVAQESGDEVVRENRLKNIRRTFHSTWDSSIIIPQGPAGEEIDRIISGALRKLKATGELQKITDTMHRPFSDWQPYEMNW